MWAGPLRAGAQSLFWRGVAAGAAGVAATRGGPACSVTRIAPTLSLYLAGQFLRATVWILAGFAGLILLFDMVELLRKSAVAGSTDAVQLIGLALMKLPHTMQDTLPFAVLVATMFALFRLSRHHELIVMRAMGFSVWQVIAPALLLALTFGVANIGVVHPVAAGLYDQYTRQARLITNPDATALDVREAGFWLRESTGEGAAVVHAAAVTQDGGLLKLTQVLLFVSDHQDRLLRRIEASDAELRDGAFRFSGVRAFVPGEPPRQFDAYVQPTGITLAQVQDSFARPETLSFWDLPAFIASSRAAGFSALPHRLYFQTLLATPIMLCAMVLVGAAFFLTALPRAGAWTARTLAGIGAGFLLYFFSRFAYTLGLSATLPVAMAAWAPALVAMLVSLSYLFHREDG
jgi:lipopolysaccharide export system permease protein